MFLGRLSNRSQHISCHFAELHSIVDCLDLIVYPSLFSCTVQFPQIRSRPFLVFGQQNLRLAVSKFFWEAEWPPLSFELWSYSKIVSFSPWCTKICFWVPILPSSCHFLFSTPSVSTFGPRSPISLWRLRLLLWRLLFWFTSPSTQESFLLC